jgi:adenylate cyclase
MSHSVFSATLPGQPDLIDGDASVGTVQGMNRLLLVDDEPRILSSLRRSLRGTGFEVLCATSGTEALHLLRREPVDAIVSDMRMPGMNGAEFLQASLAFAPDAVRVLLTGYSDADATVRAVNEGEIFRYISKPWDDHALRQALRDGLQRKALERERDALRALTERQNAELRELNQSLERLVAERTAELERTLASLRVTSERLKADFGGTLRLLSGLIEPRAGLTARCPRTVAQLVRRMAPAFGIAGDALSDLTFAALLQDIGKLTLPESLVRKPLQHLDAEARRRMALLPVVSEGLLAPLASLAGARHVLRHLSENFDGSGGPDGLRGPATPLASRVLRVAADFEHYRAGAIEPTPLGLDEAMRRLRQHAGTRYDPMVIDALVQAFCEAAVPASVPQRRLLGSAGLRAGMRLAEDLVAPTGALLLARGWQLDESMIAHIKRVEELSGAFLWISVEPADQAASA